MDVVPDTSSTEKLLQKYPVEIPITDRLPVPRTEGLGKYISMEELLRTGAISGAVGVILTDRTVRLGYLYKLSI